MDPPWVSGLHRSSWARPNDPPVVDSVAINEASPHTNDTLSVTVTSHDPNSDPVSYSYQWSRNNVDIAGATARHAEPGARPATAARATTIRVRVVANDGLDDSAPVTSSPVTVLNTDPGGDRVDRRHDTRLERHRSPPPRPGSDLDGDTVTLTYVWRSTASCARPRRHSPSLTDTFDLSQPNHGNTSDEVMVTVTPNDGEAERQRGDVADRDRAGRRLGAQQHLPISDLADERPREGHPAVGNTVYIAGQFTQIRSNNGAQTMIQEPAGGLRRPHRHPASRGTPTRTGTWRPSPHRPMVRSSTRVACSSGWAAPRTSGSRRSMPSSGAALVRNPFVDAAVKAVATEGNTVYLGGAFLNVNGDPRNRLAAVAASSGNLTQLEPERRQPGPRPGRVDSSGIATVRRRAVPPTSAGSSQNRIVALDPSSGAPALLRHAAKVDGRSR